MDIWFLSNNIKQEFDEENIDYGFFFINLVKCTLNEHFFNLKFFKTSFRNKEINYN